MARLDPQLLKSPELALRVLELLRLLHPLPSKGVVAGQSVACAIDKILGTGVAVFNDIDVFQTNHALFYPDNPAEGSALSVLGRPDGTPIFIENWKGRLAPSVTYAGDARDLPGFDAARLNPEDDYSAMETYQNFYSVLATRREGLLNRILVRYRYNSLHELSRKLGARDEARRNALMLLKGFDINSTQVGIDLTSKELVYTPAFAQYFSTRQLEITALFTPVQTLLRYFKKREELGSYGNDEAMRQLLAARLRSSFHSDELIRARLWSFRRGERYLSKNARTKLARVLKEHHLGHHHASVGGGLDGAPLVLGQKYKPLMERYGKSLRGWLGTVKHPNKELWLVVPTRMCEMPLESRHISLPESATLAVSRFKEQFFPPSKLALARTHRYQELLASVGADSTLGKVYAAAHLNHGQEFLEGIESSHAPWAVRLLKEHEELHNCVAPLPFKQQVAFLQQAKQQMQELELPEVWGAFARRTAAWASLSCQDPQVIRKTLKRIKPSLAPVVEALPLPAEHNGIRVRELRSGYDLLLEGSRMKHCVGGYLQHVEAARCRIVNLSQGPRRIQQSTTEWAIREDHSATPFAEDSHKRVRFWPLMLSCNQTRTFGNKVPSAELLQAEQELRARLNAWLAQNPKEGYALLQPKRWAALEKAIKAGDAHWGHTLEESERTTQSSRTRLLRKTPQNPGAHTKRWASSLSVVPEQSVAQVAMPF
jgi:hypothetical protein